MHGHAQAYLLNEDIAAGRIVVPSHVTYRRWELKFDMAVMAWRRHTIGDVRRTRHCGADSSPPATFNFLCAREETMAWMPGCGVSGLLGGFELESRSLPVSVLGIGKGKVADKSFKLFRSILLETGAGLGF